MSSKKLAQKMNQKTIISIRHLNYFLGTKSLRRQILFNINLDVLPGEIIILTGPSGSGKTTLLSLIGGLRCLQEGSLQVFGQELYKLTEKKLIQIRRQIGYIFQAHNLLHFMTARQNVQMSLELKRTITSQQAYTRAKDMLKAVGLEERIDHYPHQLSGGQKQRVAIARALVNHPQLILADEPTASLDSKTGREIIDIMHRLAYEQGSTIFLVTHDSRIFNIANRIIEMEDGCLIHS